MELHQDLHKSDDLLDLDHSQEAGDKELLRQLYAEMDKDDEYDNDGDEEQEHNESMGPEEQEQDSYSLSNLQNSSLASSLTQMPEYKTSGSDTDTDTELSGLDRRRSSSACSNNSGQEDNPSSKEDMPEIVRDSTILKLTLLSREEEPQARTARLKKSNSKAVPSKLIPTFPKLDERTMSEDWAKTTVSDAIELVLTEADGQKSGDALGKVLMGELENLSQSELLEMGFSEQTTEKITIETKGECYKYYY